MRLLPHEWVPDRVEPGCAVCWWCRRPFREVAGLACEADACARADTQPLPVVPARRPRRWPLWGAAALVVSCFGVLFTVTAVAGALAP